jgi:hypothetical protein
MNDSRLETGRFLNISHVVDVNLSLDLAMTCHTSPIADGGDSIVSMTDDRGEFERGSARTQNRELSGPNRTEARQKGRFMLANSVCDMLAGTCVSIQ